MRARTITTTSNEQKAQFAMSAWMEADYLEQALSRHTCNLERAYIYQGREYLFKFALSPSLRPSLADRSSSIRMYISHEFSRHIPLVTSYVISLRQT